MNWLFWATLPKLKSGLGLDFTAHVLQASSRKIFLTKYSINRPSSIIRRSFLSEISNNVFKFLFSKLML